jgi:hypothetical protein
LLEAGVDPQVIAEQVCHANLGLLVAYKRSYVPMSALRRLAEAADGIRSSGNEAGTTEDQ